MSETPHNPIFDPDKIEPIHPASKWQGFPPRKPEDDQPDIEAIDSDSGDIVYTRDFKKKQEFSGLVLLGVACQSIGVIYGDIGTSPLYVYSSTFLSPPSYEDLLGALSLIIWALTLIVTVKYVLIVLCADDEGEGGTFALFSLITRYAHITQRSPREAMTVKMERYMSKDMRTVNAKFRTKLESSAVSRGLIKVLAVLGVAMVIADGILTPAQSILGAIQGLKIVVPAIETKTIVGISCAIIVVLFAIQPFGTSKIGGTFAPIVILWLLFNASFGVYNLVIHDASVLKAFSPYYAGHWFVRNGTEGWKSLGGILLAFTGVEALFADLGAFSARAIRISWIFMAYPCLLLAYIGQAAFISHDPTAVSNPFFATVPPGMYWPSLVLSVLAAFVASQAMITGAFQLLSQTIQMSYFPNIKLVHTSKRIHSQVYLPMANFLMFLGTIVVTAVYNNTTSLGNAYGVCVISVTFITTCLVAVAAMVVWKLHFTIVIAGFLVFGTLDMLFLTASLLKIPVGAWFTLVLAGALSSLLLLWRYGKGAQWASEASGARNATKKELRVLNGLGVFFDKANHPSQLPAVHSCFIDRFEARHEATVYFHLRPLAVPHIPEDERFAIIRIHSFPNTFRVVVRHGYNDFVLADDFGAVLLGQLRVFLDKGIERSPEAGKDHVRRELEAVENAYARGVVFVFGKEALLVRGGGWVRRMLLHAFVGIRENTRGKPEEFGVDIARLVEVGFVKVI